MSFATLGLALRATKPSKFAAAAANNAAAASATTTSANARSSNTTNTNTTTTRAFHTPFAVLGNSPLAAPTTKDISYQYEKQYYELPHEPVMSSTGYRTYVVSEPEPSARHYRVPAGAYPTSSPFVQFQATPAPEGVNGKTEKYSSTGTGAGLLAHGFTTRAAPQHRGGVGESGALRYRSAPGEMGVRGGGFGGQGLVDAKGTVAGVGELAERNPQPDGSAAEKFSKGIEGAWKLRK